MTSLGHHPENLARGPCKYQIYIARFLIYEANILAFMYIIKFQGKPDQVK